MSPITCHCHHCHHPPPKITFHLAESGEARRTGKGLFAQLELITNNDVETQGINDPPCEAPSCDDVLNSPGSYNSPGICTKISVHEATFQ